MKNSSLVYLLLIFSVILVIGLLDPQIYPFPRCPFRSLTGWLCPGCGSQRAIHQALHGHFAQSFHLNPLFLPAVGYALTGLVISTFARHHWPAIRTKWYGRHAAWISLGIIVVFWIWRNVG